MFLHSECVRHARDIVTHDTGPAGIGDLCRILAPWWWQGLGLCEEDVEQVCQQAFGLAAHAVDLVMLVHAFVEEGAQGTLALGQRVREGDERHVHGAHGGGACGLVEGDAAAGFVGDVIDPDADEAPDGLVGDHAVAEMGVFHADAPESVADDGDVIQVVDGEQARGDAVIDVVIVVGNVVGQGGDLGFRAGELVGLEVGKLVEVAEGGGQAADRRIWAGDGAIVLDEAFQHFPAEVQAVEIGVADFQLGDDAQGLGVVVEAFIVPHALVELVFPGMAERRMAEIMREREGFGEVFVETERAGDAAGNLGDFEGMRQAGAVMIALMSHENLRFLLQAPESSGVDDAVAVALEGRAGR